MSDMDTILQKEARRAAKSIVGQIAREEMRKEMSTQIAQIARKQIKDMRPEIEELIKEHILKQIKSSVRKLYISFSDY